MGNRLAFSCAVLVSAGIVAMLADGSIVGASGLSQCNRRQNPLWNPRRSGSRVESDFERHRSGFGAGAEFAGDQPLGGTRCGCGLRCRQRDRQL